MTREAIEYFKFYRKIFCEDHLKICPKDSIAYQATLKEKEFYDMAIKALEQEQEPKTGHWIDTDEWRETVDGFEQWGYFRKCSKCGYVFKFLEIDNYCPNCGAKMVEPQEK